MYMPDASSPPVTNLAAADGDDIAIHQHPGGVMVVALFGEHDLATAPRVQRALDRAADDGQRLIVDLIACRFIDCSIMHLLLAAWSRGGDGPGVSLVVPPAGHPGGNLRRTLALCGVDAVMPITDTLLAALDGDDATSASTSSETPGSDQPR